MKSRTTHTVFKAAVGCLLMTGPGIVAADGDAPRGQLLYELNCTGCHDSQVHLRQATKVGDRESLEAMVLRWRDVLELPWKAEEIEAVSQYLEQRYYQDKWPK